MDDDTAVLAGWTVTGVRTLLDALYWTEPIDRDWSWCVECERLVEASTLVEHIAWTHQSD